MFDKENPALSAKDALSLLRAPLAPEGQPDSPSTLQAHEAAVAKRFASTPTLPARRAPLTPKSPNPAARTPMTPAAAFSRTTEDFDLSFNSAGAGSTPGTALSQKSAGDFLDACESRRSDGAAARRRRPSPVLESSPTEFHARMGRDSDFDEGQSTGGAFSPTVRNKVNAATIVLAAAATTPGNRKTHPTPANTPVGHAFPRQLSAPKTPTDAPIDDTNPPASLIASSSPSEEEVIEEVRSWFASVHSKLDVALSAISPAPKKMPSAAQTKSAETKIPVIDASKTVDDGSGTVTWKDASTPAHASVFPRRTASGVTYPTPALASADDLRDEARRAAAALTEAAIAKLTECDAERRLPETPGPDARLEEDVEETPKAEVPEQVPVPEQDPVPEQVAVPEEPELAVMELAATPETMPSRRAAIAADAENASPSQTPLFDAPPLVSPPASSPSVGHAAHDALAMTPETLRVVAMVTCAALLSGYTIAITVFALATVANVAAAFASAAWGAASSITFFPSPAEPEAVRCVMRGAWAAYPPGLALAVLAAEDVIGSVLDALRDASRSGMDVALGGGVQNVETSYEDDSFASPTVFHDARVVTVTWEGVAVLFFVATTATLVIGGAALFFAFFAESPGGGDVLQTLSSAVKVSPGTRRALSRVMEAVSPVSPAGSARKVRARTASSNIF